MRRVVNYLLLFCLMLVLAPVVLAQGDTPPQMNWNEVIAYIINTAAVFTGVQLVKNYGPQLPTVAKQIIALAGGPLLMMFLQPALSDALGYPIDFSLLASALSGLASSLTAMAVHDTAKISGGG